MSDAGGIPETVIRAWGLGQASAEPISSGLINRTFLVRRGDGPLVIQRLHEIFEPEVNLDIEAITRHLDGKGLLTPRLVPAVDGALWVEAGGTWRALTFVPGRSVDRVESPETAAAAGRMAARFHAALRDLTHAFHFVRDGVHDTALHLDRLREALQRRRTHRLHDRVRGIASDVLELAKRLPEPAPLPKRIVHGDLKISNVIFDEDLGEGRALVDLDTLQHGTLCAELGDALRSWCNPRGEDDPEADLDPALFEAAVRGYAEVAGPWMEPEERHALVLGTETVALELAARFCTDALEEKYFGWDPDRFESRGEHNLIRAHSQLSVAESVARQRVALQAAVSRSF